MGGARWKRGAPWDWPGAFFVRRADTSGDTRRAEQPPPPPRAYVSRHVGCCLVKKRGPPNRCRHAVFRQGLKFRRNFSFPLGTGKKYFDIFGKFCFENSKFKKIRPKFTGIPETEFRFRRSPGFHRKTKWLTLVANDLLHATSANVIVGIFFPTIVPSDVSIPHRTSGC